MRVLLPRLLKRNSTSYQTLHPMDESITFNLHSPHQAVITLPVTDPDVALHDWVHLFTASGDAGIFRVVEKGKTPHEETVLKLQHSFCVLAGEKPVLEPQEITGKLDDILFTLWMADGITESHEYWRYSSVPDTPVFTFKYNGENLMQAFYKAVKAAGNYMIKFSQMEDFLWVFYVEQIDDSKVSEGRFSRNLENVNIKEDDYDLVTRVFVDGRVGYFDADTINQWGVFSETLYLAEDVTEESLQAYVADYLNAHKNPTISIQLDAVDLSSITGESVDSFSLGSMCRACLPKYEAPVLERIVSMQITDVYGEPYHVQISMNNQIETTPGLLKTQERDIAFAVRSSGRAAADAKKAKALVLEAKELIQLNSQQIELNAEQLITLKVATEEVRTELDETMVSFNETKLTIEDLKGELSTTKTDVNNATNEVNQLKGSVTTLAGVVELKASQSSLDDLGNLVEEHAAYLRVLPGQIEAKADLILLEGYVKASQLETTNAKISNLMSGSTQAMAIDTLLLTANQVNSQFVKAASLSLGDNTMQIRTISMGDVASVRALVTGATGNVELEHSHAVIENEDGTITLGEVSSAGGSFKIADTKAYKEGVSAAKESVSLSTAGWMGPGGTNTVIASNGKSIIVSLPEFSVSGGDTWSSEHKTTINFTTPSVVGQPVKQVIVDAGEVYADGYAAGTAVGSGASYNDGYQAGKDAYKPTEIVRETYSIANKTISVRAQNSYQALLTGIAVDASEIYDAGAENVSLSSAGWIRGQNVVTASNGRTLAVDLPPFSTSVGVWDLINIKTTAYFYTPSIDGPVAQCEVNGIEPYNLGAGSVRLSSDGWINGVNTVEASNGKTFEVGPPDVTLSGGENWDPEEHTTTVFASVMGVGLPIAQMDVDASIIYDLGKAEVEITSAGWINGENVVTASNGKKATIRLPEFSVSGGDTWTSNKTTVYFSTPSVNVPLKTAEINAGSVYINGQNSVTISAGNWQNGENVVTASNGKREIVQLPAFSASESEWSGNKKSIYFSTASVSVPLKTVEIDAGSIYANGQNSVKLSEEGWKGPNGTNTVKASNGQSLIVNLPAFSVSGGEAWAGNKTTVYFSTQSVNTPLASMEVDASAVYRNGANAVTLSTAGWAAPNGTNVVEASNGRALIINLPEFNVSGGETWTENKTTVYFSTASVNVPLKSVEVDASSVYSEGVKAGSGSGYNSGYAAGKEAYAPTAISRTAYDAETKTITVKAANKHQDLLTNQTIDISDIFEAAYTAGFEDAKSLTEVRGEITSIRNTAPNTFYATGYARALVNEEQVDSTTFYATQEIKVGQ